MSDRDEGRSTASFLRGLTLGAILGAIIAGSSIWSRRLDRAGIRRPVVLRGPSLVAYEATICG